MKQPPNQIRRNSIAGDQYPPTNLPVQIWFEPKDTERLWGSVNADANTAHFAEALFSGAEFTWEESIEILQNLREMADRRLAELLERKPDAGTTSSATASVDSTG